MCIHGFEQSAWCAHCQGIAMSGGSFTWSRFTPNSGRGYSRVTVDFDWVPVNYSASVMSVPYEGTPEFTHREVVL